MHKTKNKKQPLIKRVSNDEINTTDINNYNDLIMNDETIMKFITSIKEHERSQYSKTTKIHRKETADHKTETNRR